MTETPVSEEPKPKSRLLDVGDTFGDILFNTRWLLYPMNLGLAVAGFVYMIRFLVDDYHLIVSSFSMESENIIVPLLGLVDMLMIANLLVMIYQGSHQIFIRRFSNINAEERPQWLDHVDSGILKNKVASSVAGITLIRLLKDFINIEHTDWEIISHRAIIHVICLVSCIVMSLVWRITHPPEVTHAQQS
jgi:uncharacterized protein (TIGR00645 family)